MNIYYKLLFLSLFIESFTGGFTKSVLLSGLRTKISSKFGSSKVDILLSCGYCFSFWVSLFVVITSYIIGLDIKIFHADRFEIIINFILQWFILHRLSNMIHGLIDRFFDTSKDIRYNRQ